MTRLAVVWRRCWLLGAVLYLVCRLLSRHPAFLAALGIFLADLSGHGADPGLVLPRAENPAPGQHPPLWRLICFVVGVASFWIVLQTRIDYYAQHMFFVHRCGAFRAASCSAPS